jgi:hypothetical protein
MKSKLLQKKSDCLNKSREGLDGQQENVAALGTLGGRESATGWLGDSVIPVRVDVRAGGDS